MKYPEDFVNKIINGDCIEVMKQMPDKCVDSIVTDPPYELGFMGKAWDNTGIAYNVDMWKQALRVLKPGGHLLSFGGTRTYHRMACAIEDAGFEVRDMVEWIYGSGFPKSLDIGKAIDKKKILNEETVREYLRNKLFAYSREHIAQITNTTVRQVDHWIKLNESQPQTPAKDKWDILINKYELIDAPHLNWDNQGKIIGIVDFPITWNSGDRFRREATTPEAKQWEGWGTALKPAHEPICMARKPLSEKTVAENVLKHGTGGINIDESRIKSTEFSKDIGTKRPQSNDYVFKSFDESSRPSGSGASSELGRFPSNLIHDGSDVVLAEFAKAGESKSVQRREEVRNYKPTGNQTVNFGGGNKDSEYSDSGSPARFFYTAKSSSSERNMLYEDIEEKYMDEGREIGSPGGTNPRNRGAEKPRQNSHPTVKPVILMQYLIRLVTPPKGIVLDPFLGSGTTALAAKDSGFSYIGIEIDPEYVKIAEARMKQGVLPF